MRSTSSLRVCRFRIRFDSPSRGYDFPVGIVETPHLQRTSDSPVECLGHRNHDTLSGHRPPSSPPPGPSWDRFDTSDEEREEEVTVRSRGCSVDGRIGDGKKGGGRVSPVDVHLVIEEKGGVISSVPSRDPFLFPDPCRGLDCDWTVH